MGIFGLTSYVTQYKSEFLDDCKLYNCPVLIDGNSAASLIYSNLTRSNHAFGGDYDKYAHSTNDFLRLLKKCGVTPIFIFDGGYEQRKLKTVLERIKMNIIVCGQYKNKYRESKSFPLMLRETFRAVLNELKISVVQCDFEADSELVVLSRILNCPLISYDSDFCITDSQYIPFTSIDFKAVRFKKKSSQRKYYLPCKMFNVNTFLNRFGGLVDKSMLPLLSCVLGNDYIPPNTFKNFLRLNHLVTFEERVDKIVRWMAKISSVDEAVNQMVACVGNNGRNMKKKINHLLADYNRSTSDLLDYIPQEFVETALCHKLENVSVSNSKLKSKKTRESIRCQPDLSDSDASINDTDEESRSVPHSDEDGIIVLEVEEYEIQCSDNEDGNDLNDPENCCNESQHNFYGSFTDVNKQNDNNVLNDVEILNSTENCSLTDSIVDESILTCSGDGTVFNDDGIRLVNLSEAIFGSKVPDWFLKKYRLGIITPNLINVINFQRVFIPSQSEDYFSKPSHEICLPIWQVIVGIIVRENTTVSKVKCHARCKGMHLGVYDVMPVFEVRMKPLPSLFDITSLNGDTRASILMDCLGIPTSTSLRLFPAEWKLFVLILMYWKKHCKQPAFNDSHIRAVIICLIYLNVIDRKVGFARTISDMKRLKKERKRSRKILDAEAKNSVQINENSSLVDENQISANENQSLLDEGENSISGNQSVNADALPVIESHLLVVRNLSQFNGNVSFIHEDSSNELFDAEHEYNSVDDYLDVISEEDCYKSATVLLDYHQVNPVLLKNRKNFDLKIIHSFAQLQHCIQSISTLNSVLNFPFVQCQTHLCFSGTFLYNFYSELHTRKLADGYITRTLLTKMSTVIALYRYLISSWTAVTTMKIVRPKFEVKKKKKRNSNPLTMPTTEKSMESESYHDPDNIYSMLPEE